MTINKIISYSRCGHIVDINSHEKLIINKKLDYHGPKVRIIEDNRGE